MHKIKNEKGITLVTTAVTIILLLILAAVSLNSGLSSVTDSKVQKIQAELQMVQQAAISEYTKAKQLGYTNSNETPLNFVGTKVSVSSLPTDINWQITTEPVEAYKAYYEVTPSDLERLNITGSEDTYILNYYTGEVYNKTQHETSDNQPLYIKATTNIHVEKTEDNDSFNDWVE